MSRFTGAKRAARRAIKAGRGRVTATGQWLGLAEGGSAAPSRAVRWGNVPEPVRRAGRWLLVRGLASAAFRPKSWAAGLAVVGLAIPGPWWLASIAITPFGIYRWVSRSRVAGILTILSAVSRRVKSLRLRRLLLRSWPGLMTRLGLSREVQRRRLRKPPETVTVVPKLGRIRLTEYGVTVRGSTQRLDLPVSALSKFSEHIESGLGVPHCSIAKIGPGLFKMDLRHTDPLAEIIRVAELPAPRRYLHVVPALSADGSGIEQPLPPLHLAVGATRSGKSEYALTVTKLILDQGIPLRLRIFAKEQEYTELRSAAYDFETNMAQWPAMLSRWYNAMRARQASLAERGIKELRNFTDSDPLDLLILDEFLAVLAMRNHDVRTQDGVFKAHAVLNLMASQMIAAGYGMVALAQLGQKEVIGAVRDLFSSASMFRVPLQASEMVNAVLGPNADKMYPAHQIEPGIHTRGRGFTQTPTGLILPSRVAYLDDGERAELVKQVAGETRRLRSKKRTNKRAEKDEHEMAEAAA